MLNPPRPHDAPLLTGALAWHILLVSLLFVCGCFGIYAYAIDRGYSVELARTFVVNTLVVMEIFHLFFVRNIYGTSLTWQLIKGTRVVWLSITTITAAQFAMTYWKPLQQVFQTQSVPIFDGMIIVSIGAVLFTIIEIEKQLRFRLRKVKSVRKSDLHLC